MKTKRDSKIYPFVKPDYASAVPVLDVEELEQGAIEKLKSIKRNLPVVEKQQLFDDDVYASNRHIHVAIGEIAATGDKKESGGQMDDYLKVLIEKLDTDAREREQRYHKDAQEREQRYREEAKEREERIASALHDLKTDLKAEMTEVKNEVRNTKINLTALSITTILGIAAMVVGVLIAIFQVKP